jgi:hypothetical protein
MRKGFTFIALAALVAAAPACIIVTDDGDDSGGNTSNNPTSGTPGTSNGSAETSTPTDTGSTAATSADGTTAADETASVPACGWGPTGEEPISEGYVCTGDGEDPDGNFPIDCPADVDLAVGGDCGPIQGQGCCDAQGDAWFCGDDGSGPALVRLDC